MLSQVHYSPYSRHTCDHKIWSVQLHLAPQKLHLKINAPMCSNSRTVTQTPSINETLADSSWRIQLSTPAFSQTRFLRLEELPTNIEIELSWSAQIIFKLTAVICPLSSTQQAQTQLCKTVKVSAHMYRKWEGSLQPRLKTLVSVFSISHSSSNKIILLRPKVTLKVPMPLRLVTSNQATLLKETCFNRPTSALEEAQA